MRVTITQDFDTPEAAATFLARVGNPAHVIDALAAAPVPTPTEKVDMKKDRKPRSDAGQVRGPNARTTTGEPAALEPGQSGGGIPAKATPAAPAIPTTTAASTPPQAPASTGASGAASSSSAPEASLAAQQSAQGAPQKAAAPAAEDFPADLDGARKAMSALNKTKGKGMDACIGALKAHGVNRISDLPKDKFAPFIKDVLGQASPEGIKEAIAEKAPKK